MSILLLRRLQLAAAWTLGLWFVYRAVMWLKRRREAIEEKSRALYYLAYALVAAAWVLDVAYNWIVGTVLFADPPRELTFTSRLKRYRREPYVHYDLASWRYRFATWFCRELLNPYDPEHC